MAHDVPMILAKKRQYYHQWSTANEKWEKGEVWYRFKNRLNPYFKDENWIRWDFKNVTVREYCMAYSLSLPNKEDFDRMIREKV